MLQNPCKTLGFKKNMVYKIPPGGGGGKPYPASGLVGSIASVRPRKLHFTFSYDMGVPCSTSNNSKVYKIEK